jgi:glutamyl-tRNA reductase
LYVHEGSAAVHHLFRVAGGVDSLVVGETQILGQIRAALARARTQGTAGRRLTGVFHHALATGKRARTETAISTGAFSVGRAGAELARTLVPDLPQATVLIVGAGAMAELAARHLMALGARMPIIANRTLRHAETLADRLGGRAIGLAGIEAVLTQVDLVISSTSAPRYVLQAGDIARAMARREGRPLCLIDIAVPRDIDPAAGELPHVYRYDMDDLLRVTEGERRRRLAEAPQVEAIIAQEVERCMQRQAGLDAAPTIAALRLRFERTRQAELARLHRTGAALNPEQQAAVEAMTRTLVNKLLHTPTVQLKHALAQQPGCEADDVLCTLFALTDTTTGSTSYDEDA